ncbi:hypothetical protein SteCoe_2276 [Stentor coeruleus]|uniref:Methyltransferase domain-containing protein n=1 Tax=Stentor coeruleus TaxID=5963 RepID=A0A1R2CZT0_9CILI|nr:hypothetical protein SteCoe_2276 [Stentor coeruleus]
MPNYGDPEYWEKRYEEQKGKTFDWLEDYETLSIFIKHLISPDNRILILGCGNAELSEDMYQDGFTHIDNIDISSVVIQQMKDRNLEKNDMSWTVMDVMDLKFPNNYFDLAIDKSTIDALLCGDNAFINVAKMTKEVQRVLKVGGVYMAISYGIPDTRLEHFSWKHLNWEVSYQIIGPELDGAHYLYLCRKKEGADEICDENWEDVEATLTEGKTE